MRNLKKILALVLALVMSMSLMATANAFTDSKDIDGTYDEAVQVLNALGVFEGYNDGSFNPKGTITRAEVAAIIYRIVTGDTTKRQNDLYSDYNVFSDVPTTHWAAGYIGYCANAEYISGYGNGKFGPSDPVTGYQALAMILRAVGYDKNGEFKGTGWEVRTAQIANERQITKNLKETTLRTPATREIVAEILFQAILVDKANYTPALGYQIWGTTSIGYETFGLVGSVLGADVWGRPADVWMIDRNNNETAELAIDTKLIAIPYAADYSTNVRVDECDIAYEMGLAKSTALEKAFIDGVEIATASGLVTTNGVATINPLATTSLVGAQGRITEAYIMPNGTIRLVEINTYLAQVTAVYPTVNDKHDHPTTAVIDLDVYSVMKDEQGAAVVAPADTKITWKFAHVEADGFNRGDYVLVNVADVDKATTLASTNRATIEGIELAEIVNGGNLAGWTAKIGTTPATHKIVETIYNDADKFVLHLRDASKVWNVALDPYGNAIGLIEATKNYMAIEKIEWQSSWGTVAGGYALANLRLADGSLVENVTIANINTNAPVTAEDTGAIANRSVSAFFSMNTEYYGHIWTYSVNENGSYNISNAGHPAAPIYDANSATIIKGQATINTAINTYVATDSTVFMLKTGNFTYDVYVGKDNVPSIDTATLCILTDGNGFAKIVVATNYTAAANTFLAYVTDGVIDLNDTPYGNGYFVYKLGETAPTTVYDANITAWTDNYNTTHGTGIYQFTLNAMNQITGMSLIADDLHCDASAANIGGINLDRLQAKGVVDNSLQGQSYGGGQPGKDFNITSTTKFIVATKSGDVVSLASGSAANVAAGDKLFVTYTTTTTTLGATKHDANVVYIIKSTTGPVAPGSIQNATEVSVYEGTTRPDFKTLIGQMPDGLYQSTAMSPLDMPADLHTAFEPEDILVVKFRTSLNAASVNFKITALDGTIWVNDNFTVATAGPVVVTQLCTLSHPANLAPNYVWTSNSGYLQNGPMPAGIYTVTVTGTGVVPFSQTLIIS